MHKKVFGIFWALLSSLFLVSGQQNFTVSPSAALPGIGQINPVGTTSFLGLGKRQTGWLSTSEIQIANPAAHVFLESPAFNVDVVATLAFLEDQNRISDLRQFYGFQNVGLGFSVLQKWGTYIGLAPFSNNGYYYELNISENGQNVQKVLQGSGSIYQLIWGNSFMIFKTPRQALSLGFNLKYYFGQVRDEQKAFFPNLVNGNHFIFTQTNNWNDIGVDAGLMYRLRLTEDWNLGLGATYALGKNMRVDREGFIQSYTINSDGLAVYDVPLVSEKQRDRLFLPQAFALGVSSSFRNEITFGLDFFYQELDQLKLENGTTPRSIWQLSGGIEFHPSGLNPIGLSAYKRLYYRLGGNISTLPFGAMQYSAQAGVGVPILMKYLKSNANIGLVYDQINGGVLQQERYLSLYVGFSLGPAAYESWFRRKAYY